MEGNSVKDLKPFANEENFKSLRVFRDITYNKFQFMNLSKNKIVDLGPIKIASLVSLNLNDNRIEKFES
jgi:Leucine-rich repeat (LRR) protein